MNCTIWSLDMHNSRTPSTGRHKTTRAQAKLECNDHGHCSDTLPNRCRMPLESFAQGRDLVAAAAAAFLFGTPKARADVGEGESGVIGLTYLKHVHYFNRL